MLRERTSRLMSYLGLRTKIKKTMIGMLSLTFGTSFIKNPLGAIKTFDIQYDLAVIGGGSGGLATAFEANKHGLNVIVIDFVEETIHKSKWGLGGTCVNVGCIPKKLMHQAAKSHEQLFNAYDYGWELPENINNRQNSEQMIKQFNWTKLRSKIQSYIKSINFGYIASVNKVDNMEYLNCLATFKDKDTVICSKNPAIIHQFVKTGTLPKNDPSNPVFFEIKAKNFVIATGTRPSYLKVEGSHHAITSDDVFMKKQAPGKTLIIGGGYVAVEIAGFLHGMGYQVSMMTRGDYLRAFDRDMVDYIIDDLKMRKVNVVENSLPTSIKKKENGKLEVIIQNQKTKQIKDPQDFDTVLFAVGRNATTDTLNLSKIGVDIAKNKKILTRTNEIQRTNIDNIYALGDVVQGLPELTSTATKMGWHLGRRIVQKMGKKKFQDHEISISIKNYPTTVFTPVEYSCCGFSEEDAIVEFGRENINVYHTKYVPLEQSILQKYNEDGSNYKINVYAKAIVQKSTDKVLGLHYAGPNAGEVMQGFAVAMRIGLTKQQLNSTIGIHPTCAEELTNMEVTKQSGLPYQKTAC